jgi:hypothetical protein
LCVIWKFIILFRCWLNFYFFSSRTQISLFFKFQFKLISFSLPKKLFLKYFRFLSKNIIFHFNLKFILLSRKSSHSIENQFNNHFHKKSLIHIFLWLRSFIQKIYAFFKIKLDDKAPNLQIQNIKKQSWCCFFIWTQKIYADNLIWIHPEFPAFPTFPEWNRLIIIFIKQWWQSQWVLKWRYWRNSEKLRIRLRGNKWFSKRISSRVEIEKDNNKLTNDIYAIKRKIDSLYIKNKFWRHFVYESTFHATCHI